MSTWQRLVPFDGIPPAQSAEQWIYTGRDGRQVVYPIRTTYGKAFDVLALKGANLSETAEYAAFLRRTAARLYGSGAPRRCIANCPCCGADTERHGRECYRFFDVPVHRCDRCGHGFVLEQPAEEVLSAVFAESENHSSVYIDRNSLDARMREVIAPKLSWVRAAYQSVYDDALPRTGIDVGAGGGHFVAGMLRAGIDGIGYELSSASRRFASEAFGIELRNEDFLSSAPESVDLVTFWGLLEYTPQPRRFLEAARKRMPARGGLLAVEVPRLECLGTAVQAENPYAIARHMDPTSHVNTFSDASLATALVETGFKPIAVWYFGMDVYELLMQAALRLNDARLIERLADMIPALQASLDHGRQCDDIVVAAVPVD